MGETFENYKGHYRRIKSEGGFIQLLHSGGRCVLLIQ